MVAGKKGSRDRGVADGIASVAVVPVGNSIRLDESRVNLASFGHFEVGLLHLEREREAFGLRHICHSHGILLDEQERRRERWSVNLHYELAFFDQVRSLIALGLRVQLLELALGSDPLADHHGGGRQDECHELLHLELRIVDYPCNILCRGFVGVCIVGRLADEATIVYP